MDLLTLSHLLKRNKERSISLPATFPWPERGRAAGVVGPRKRTLDEACFTWEKSVGLSMLNFRKECWIILVGFRRRVLD